MIFCLLLTAALGSVAVVPSPGLALDDVDATISNLHNPNPVVRRSAVLELAGINDPRVVAPLKAALKDPDEQVRALAQAALSRMADASDARTGTDLHAGFATEVTAALSSDGVQRATIIVDSYSFKPDHLIATRGVPLELTLTSVTWLVPHNFVINDPEAGVTISREVPAGKSVTVRFTPRQAGRYKFFCDKKLLFFPSHEEKGMTGTLDVR